MSHFQIAQNLAADILAAIPWRAGDFSGTYVDQDAFGNNDDNEWED